MTTKNTEAQRAYKKRMRAAGYEQVQVWIQSDRKPVLIAFAEGLRELDRAHLECEKHRSFLCRECGIKHFIYKGLDLY